jgi:hypothetical protein
MSLTFIDGESTGDQYSTKDGSEEQNHLPVSRVVRTHDLQLSVKIEGEEDEAGKPGSRVAGRKRLQGVVDCFPVSSTDRPVVHVVRKLRARGSRKLGHVWLANGVKVRTKTPDQPFDPNL